MKNWINQCHFGDCIETMRQMPDGMVQTCVTSPPYFGLRDYGHDGQIGLEATPDQFIAKLVDVFREVKRVLRDDGTLWLNIGDSYAGGKTGRDDANNDIGGRGGNKLGSGNPGGGVQRKVAEGYKQKDLIGIPWMLAFALRADGWYLRQEIIWHKPNPMPESVTDRCTKAHESIFLLAKSERYFYDSEAVKEPVAQSTVARLAQPTLLTQAGSDRVPGKTNGNMKAVGGSETRNRRSVWTVATRPYKGAHFATFPPALIEPCILAGTSERGHCPECGARWVRETEALIKVDHGGETESAYPKGSTANRLAMLRQAARAQGMEYTGARRTTGWRAGCDCGCAPVPDVVLDPFMGSGTTAAVAIQHGRQYLGCELNLEYGPLQQERIKAATPAPEMQFRLELEAA